MCPANAPAAPPDKQPIAWADGGTAPRLISDTIAELGLDLQIILNTDALMVLPPGVDKASGLVAALSELSIPASAVAAIGDAENDIVFLKLCGYAVAVANAIPSVKAMADLVTEGRKGAGVEELVERLIGAVGGATA